MKCPHCKIHYMDEERVCPMCGTPNPHGKQRSISWEMQPAGKKTAKQPSGKRTQTRQARPSANWGQQTRTGQKTEHKNVRIVGFVIWLFSISLIVLAVGIVAESVFSAFFDDSVNREAVYEEQVQADEAAFKKVAGIWEAEETGELLTIDADDWSYTLGDQEKGYLELRSSEIEEQDGETVYFYELSCYPLGQDAYTMNIGYKEEGSALVTLHQDGVDDEEEEVRIWHRAEETEA